MIATVMIVGKENSESAAFFKYGLVGRKSVNKYCVARVGVGVGVVRLHTFEILATRIPKCRTAAQLLSI